MTAREEHGRDSVMIAARRADVDELNTRARDRMAATGHLTGPVLDAAGRAFQNGDEVLCLRNNRRLGLTNGTRGTITTIDHDTGSHARLLAERRTVQQRLAEGRERLHGIDERLNRLASGLSRLTRRNDIACVRTEHARITADLAATQEHLLELDRRLREVAKQGHERASTEMPGFATLRAGLTTQRHSAGPGELHLTRRNRDHTLNARPLDPDPPGLEIA